MILSKFFVKQISDIRQKGINEFFKKLKILIYYIMFLPFYLISIPIYLIIIIMSPFLVIRIGVISTYLFGALATFPEIYCCERNEKKKSLEKPQIDLFYFKLNEYVSNTQLKKMWKRELIFLPGLVLQPLSHINNLLSKLISRLKIHDINHEISYYRDKDVNGLFDKYQPHLKFSEEEKKKGKKILKKFGLSEGAKFVCLTVRDSSYDKKYTSFRASGYHDFRNMDIYNFLLAADEVAKRGYWVFRMGKKVEKKLNSSNPKIIDYVNSDLRSDFMDIYLSANCSFCISSSTGLDQISYVFRKPIAHIVSPISIMFSFSNKFVSLFKHHINKNDNTKLSLSEIFKSGCAFFYYKNEFVNKSIELKDNSPEEIRDLAIEVLERYEGTWKNKAEDENLKKKFWEIFFKNVSSQSIEVLGNNLERMHKNTFKGSFSAKFLRENESFLK